MSPFQHDQIEMGINKKTLGKFSWDSETQAEFFGWVEIWIKDHVIMLGADLRLKHETDIRKIVVHLPTMSKNLPLP